MIWRPQVVVRSLAELVQALDRARAGQVRTIRLVPPTVVDARLSGTPDAPLKEGAKAPRAAAIDVSLAVASPSARQASQS